MAIKCLNTMLSLLKPNKGDSDNTGDNGTGSGDDQNGTDTNGDTGTDTNGDSGSDKGDTNGDTNGDTGGDQDGGDGGSDKGGDQQGQGGDQGDNQQGTGDKSGDQQGKKPTTKNGGAGGSTGTEQDWSELINQIKDDLAKGKGSDLLDNNSAMEQAIADKIDELVSDCNYGEYPYIEGDTSQDEIKIVRESGGSKSVAQGLLDQVREQTNYLRSSLRQMVRAMEHTATLHGTRKGNFMSNRTMVDTVLSMKNNRMPQRAFYNTEDQVDTSIACAICLDESGSMSGDLEVATRMLMALTEPLDSIGAKVLAYGFRDCYPNGRLGHPSASHRAQEGSKIIYDVFKSWNERFTTVKGRFAHTRADGSTPMADGIQFGFDNLKGRTEKHRILFVLTDGEPNYGHAKVIQWQIRKAKEMGIHIVGIGWGRGGSGVKTLYPDNVWCQNVEDVPSALVAKLRTLLKERVRRKVS